jgi:hypothetical protein
VNDLIICDICKKKMPDHILEPHMRKSHGVLAQKEVDLEPEVIFNKPKFDYETGEKCASCGQEIPQILMPYHSHVKHGI